MGEYKNILVSVCMITYNHEDYINQAIESIMMQKTNFLFELIIGEDCSTDNTRKICQKYKERYPDRIRLILPESNVGMMKNLIKTIEACNGKYIAMCEGDDYWTDSLKLQKQVDFLEANTNASLVFSDRIIQNKDHKKVLHYKNRIYTTVDILSGFIPGVQNMCIRTLSLDISILQKFASDINGDRLIPYLCSLNGQIRWVQGVFSVYRITGNGISSSRSVDEIFKVSMTDILMFHKALNFPNNRALIKAQIVYITSFINKNFTKPIFVFREIDAIISQYKKKHLSDLFFYIYYLVVNLFVRFLKKMKLLKCELY